MSEVSPGIIAMVKVTTDRLEDWELAAFYVAITTGDTEISKKTFYEKVKPLLTEENGVHRETLRALDVIVQQRLKGAS
jgi:hypothetical protein